MHFYGYSLNCWLYSQILIRSVVFLLQSLLFWCTVCISFGLSIWYEDTGNEKGIPLMVYDLTNSGIAIYCPKDIDLSST